MTSQVPSTCDPGAVELLAEHQHAHLGVAPGVGHLGPLRVGRDDDPALVVHTGRHRRGLHAARAPIRHQHHLVPRPDEVQQLVDPDRGVRSDGSRHDPTLPQAICQRVARVEGCLALTGRRARGGSARGSGRGVPGADRSPGQARCQRVAGRAGCLALTGQEGGLPGAAATATATAAGEAAAPAEPARAGRGRRRHQSTGGDRRERVHRRAEAAEVERTAARSSRCTSSASAR